MSEQISKTIAACAGELERDCMTDEASAYRAMIFTGLAKLDELLSHEQLHSDLIRIRAYVDHLLGEDADEARH